MMFIVKMYLKFTFLPRPAFSVQISVIDSFRNVVG